LPPPLSLLFLTLSSSLLLSPPRTLQGKLEALPLRDAISVLEAAWATAYKVIGGDASSVSTKDMITGASLPHNGSMLAALFEFFRCCHALTYSVCQLLKLKELAQSPQVLGNS
jgi:hypothetical protein